MVLAIFNVFVLAAAHVDLGCTKEVEAARASIGCKEKYCSAHGGTLFWGSITEFVAGTVGILLFAGFWFDIICGFTKLAVATRVAVH